MKNKGNNFSYQANVVNSDSLQFAGSKIFIPSSNYWRQNVEYIRQVFMNIAILKLMQLGKLVLTYLKTECIHNQKAQISVIKPQRCC